MEQDPEDVGFPAYLRATIQAAGFETPTQFARKAGVEPSVIFAWLRGDRRPAIRLLERVAPTLNVETQTLVGAAYPEIANSTVATPTVRILHPLAAEVERLLGAGSPLNPEEQQRVATIVEAAVAPYASRTRRRRAG